MCFRLESAVAILVVARQTLLAQAADHDLEIARCLAHVMGLLDSEIARLRRLSPADGSSADSSSADALDSATMSDEIDPEAAVRDSAVRRTP